MAKHRLIVEPPRTFPLSRLVLSVITATLLLFGLGATQATGDIPSPNNNRVVKVYDCESIQEIWFITSTGRVDVRQRIAMPPYLCQFRSESK